MLFQASNDAILRLFIRTDSGMFRVKILPSYPPYLHIKLLPSQEGLRAHSRRRRKVRMESSQKEEEEEEEGSPLENGRAAWSCGDPVEAGLPGSGYPRGRKGVAGR